MKTIGIILSPSSQPENKCVICGSEEAHCRHLAHLIADYLSHYSNIKTHIIAPQPPDIETGVKLRRIAEESNRVYDQWQGQCDHVLHIPLHTNAHNGQASGHLILHYPTNRLTDALAHELRTLLGQARIQPNTTFYEIRNVKASTLYLETFFHDNMSDATKLHTQLPDLASKICIPLLKLAK